MSYTSDDPDLIDLQAQISAILAAQNTILSSLKTQIKQAVLTLESEFKGFADSFTALKTYVQSNLGLVSQLAQNQGLVKSATVTLTDSLIKALPTTPVQIIEAPGDNKSILVVRAFATAGPNKVLGTGLFPHTNTGSEFFAPYTNVGNHAVAGLGYGQALNEIASNYNSYFGPFLLGNETGVSFTPWISTNIAIGPEIFDTGHLMGEANNHPIVIFSNNWDDSNVSMGNFTGGNIANTLKIVVYYITTNT